MRRRAAGIQLAQAEKMLRRFCNVERVMTGRLRGVVPMVLEGWIDEEGCGPGEKA
jgi:hypothetical protein